VKKSEKEKFEKLKRRIKTIRNYHPPA